jgi:hypothetical protein
MTVHPRGTPRPTEDAERSTGDVGVAGQETHRDTYPVAPDGQLVVDGRASEAEERAAIDRASARQEQASRIERTQTPEGRYLSWRHAQPGPILALLAGLFTLAIRTWPIAVPQGRGAVGTAWFVVATLAGALYIAGFFLSDRNWKRARLVLVCGALLHLIVGVLAGLQVDAQGVAPAPRAMLFDVVPAVVALVAAFLISAPPAGLREPPNAA